MTLPGWVGFREPRGRLGGRYAKNRLQSARPRRAPHRRGVFVPAFYQPMTHGFEGSQVGATPIEEGMPQKTARNKLFMMQNVTPPDVGPPLRRGENGVRSPRPENGHLLAPRVDQLAHLSGTERQGCSWGASRESGGRAAAQPPCACAPARRWSHGDLAPAFISQLQGAPGGLQPGHATRVAGRTSSSERQARTRLCQSPPGATRSGV